jgi:ABC-type transporter Mla subunit MlaD
VIRRIATVLLVIAGSIAVLVTTGGKISETGKGAGAKEFKIAFDNAFGLTEGGDLRVGGVKAGTTKTFDLSNGPECQDTQTKGIKRACAIVSAEITEPGFQSFRSDATCAIRQQSLIGEYYVDCQPGVARTELKRGGMIVAKKTQSTIPADLVADVMRRPYRDRLRLIIAELGTGLAGRPQDISELLHKAHPGLRETDKVLRILANQDTVIKNFISNSNTVVRQLDQRKSDLQNWIREAGTTANISASRRTAIAAGFQRLPATLDGLRGTMARLGQFTDAQTPLLRDLHAAAPDLNQFFTKLGPFTQASRPAFRSLSGTSDAGRRAFADSTQEINELRAVAKGAPATAKPLRQFLQTLDDRNRSTEVNPQAAQLAPPSPDPTSKATNRGFTGMEALWNYFYNQAQALSLFDNYSHILRGVAIQDPDCSKYIANLRGPDMRGGSADKLRIRKKCASWLGPHQPGVNMPDFMPETYRGSKTVSASSAALARNAGLPPEATKPLPGQIDYSKPHPTLPYSQQQLQQSLGQRVAAGAPAAPAVDGASAEQILSYLLAP